VLLAANSTALCAAPAFAQQQHIFAIEIPAGPLGASLTELSRSTGISVGLGGEIPNVRVGSVKGRMTVDEALRRLLSGTALQAVRIGPRAYRLEMAAVRPARRPVPQPRSRTRQPVIDLPAPIDIIVTGQKQVELLEAVPLGLSVVQIDPLRSGVPAADSWTVALGSEGLALTNLGPARNRQFIRGVADSPFNGPSQSTVAVQLNDARLTFDAPDPDLRLIDVDRVEILKGPQGPLYGSGALGGIYHIVTNRPDLSELSGSAQLSGEVVQHGGIGVGGQAVINLPLAEGKLAARGVVYDFGSPGWIDNAGRENNANRAHIYGGRLAIRWEPFDGWAIDLGGVIQNINVDDSQYVLASDDSLTRDHPVGEPSDNDFSAATGTVRGRIGAIDLVSATSYIDHRVDFMLDASAVAADFGFQGVGVFRDNRHYSIFNQELRLSPSESHRWLAGVSIMQAKSHDIGMIESGNQAVQVVSLNRNVAEYGAFAELVVPLIRKMDARIGGRLFYTSAKDENAEGLEPASRVNDFGLSPSVALSWHPRKGRLVYLRYAGAVRPGGLAPGVTEDTHRFDSDELGSLELGARLGAEGEPLTLRVSLYYTNWSHIQSDFLLANGLISTRNAGTGRIFGAEAGIGWRIREQTLIDAGFSVQDASLTHTEGGLELHDRRLPVSPDMTARFGVRQNFVLGGWDGLIAAQANYVGSARLTFDEDLDREMGKYATVATNAALVRDGISLTARVDNLFDVKGDSFAFGNPFSIRRGAQFTPLRPRTLTLSVGYRW
jgi:iron complex outermembrane receptor protein